MILTHLKFHIFTPTTTFHHTTIGYHNMKNRYGTNITMSLFGHFPMNKVVGVSPVNQNNHFVVLDATNQIQSLGSLKT
jgi:hypothetical protein